MEPYVTSFSSNNGICQGTIAFNGWDLIITGTCKAGGAPKMRYAAAAPADLRMSYMGSGLPFPNEEVAYEGSPNVGEVQLNGGQFSFRLVNPNSYYKNNSTTLVRPHVMFTIGDQYFDVPVPAREFPNRSLTSMPGRTNRVSRGAHAQAHAAVASSS